MLLVFSFLILGCFTQRSTIHASICHFHRWVSDPFLWNLFSLGIIFGCIMAYYLLKKDGRGWHEHVFDLGITIAFVGIIGGRLWDVFFFDWDYYHDHLLEIPYVWQGGMAIRGGVIFACVVAISISESTRYQSCPLRIP